MNKIKSQKGITLVALIITIVVLLILAIVAIGAVKDSGIIAHAQNAATDYEAKQKEEEGLLAQYETLLDKQMGIGPWKVQEDGTIKNGKTEETVEIGATFTNDEVLAATGGTASTYTGTWTILGVENGRLKLVSTTNVGSYVTLGKTDPNAPADLEEIFDIAGEETSLDVEKAIWSYKNAVNTLNTAAQTATGIASARSITIEDLEAEDVLNITNAKKVELYSDYGKTYNYFYNTDKLKVSSRNKAVGSETWSGVTTSSYDEEVFVDKKGNTVVVDSENDEVTLDNTYYYYLNAFTDTKFASSLGKGDYWLASPCVYMYPDAGRIVTHFYMSYVEDGCLNHERDRLETLFNPNGYAHDNISGVRAVVYI